MTIAEQLKAQGFERGQRQSLEKLMALKFGPLPDSVTTRIRSADARLLDLWLGRVLTSDTPEAVVQV